MYGTQSEIMIYGNGTFFFLETVFIAQSKIFALLSVSSLYLLANDSRNALLLTCSKVISRKLCLHCPTLFNQYWSLFTNSALHSSSLLFKTFSRFWSFLLSSASMYSSLSCSWSFSWLSLSFIFCFMDFRTSINFELLHWCLELPTCSSWICLKFGDAFNIELGLP